MASPLLQTSFFDATSTGIVAGCVIGLFVILHVVNKRSGPPSPSSPDALQAPRNPTNWYT